MQKNDASPVKSHFQPISAFSNDSAFPHQTLDNFCILFLLKSSNTIAGVLLKSGNTLRPLLVIINVVKSGTTDKISFGGSSNCMLQIESLLSWQLKADNFVSFLKLKNWYGLILFHIISLSPRYSIFRVTFIALISG